MNQPHLTHTSFLATDGVELPALWFTSAGKNPETAFVFLHGCGSASVFYKPKKMALFAEAAARRGAGFLAFNNRGAHYIKKLTRHLPNGESTDEKIGTAVERIIECIPDIEGAISYLQEQGVKKIILVGESTGANKICVFHEHRPDNPCVGYALVGGGDDTGIWHEQFGAQVDDVRSEAQRRVQEGTDRELYTPSLESILTYRALDDLLDPDGEYNCFPFGATLSGTPVSTKPAFHAFASITKPTFVLYGELDPFCMTNPHQAIEIFVKHHPQPALLSTKVVSGADHGFTGMEQQEVDAIMAWWDEQFADAVSRA